MSIVYCFDPANSKKHALAVGKDNRLVRLQLYDIEAPRELIPTADFVIESQFVGPRSNSASILKLAIAAGHLLGSIGVWIDEVTWMRPSDWKRKLCRGQAPKTKHISLYRVHSVIRRLLDPGEQNIYDTALAAVESQSAKMDLCDATGMLLVYLGRC